MNWDPELFAAFSGFPLDEDSRPSRTRGRFSFVEFAERRTQKGLEDKVGDEDLTPPTIIEGIPGYTGMDQDSQVYSEQTGLGSEYQDTSDTYE